MGKKDGRIGFIGLHVCIQQDGRDWKLWLASNASHAFTMRKTSISTLWISPSVPRFKGFGVAMADISLIEEDARMKRLVRPFAESVKPELRIIYARP